MKPTHRSGASGVFATTQRFKLAFRNIVCERPPRPRFFGTGTFLMARPPLLCKEGNLLFRTIRNRNYESQYKNDPDPNWRRRGGSLSEMFRLRNHPALAFQRWLRAFS